MNAVHISTAIHMLTSPEPVTLTVVTKSGELQTYENCIGLKCNHYGGCRNVKLLGSGEIRKVRDCLILAINGMEVFL